MILVALLLAAFLVNLDTTLVNVALPALVRELHATTTQLLWVVDSFNLVFAGAFLRGLTVGCLIVGCLIVGAVAAAGALLAVLFLPPSLPGQQARRPVNPEQPKTAALPGPNRTPPQRPGNPAAANCCPATPD